MWCNPIARNTDLQGRIHKKDFTYADKVSLQMTVSQRHTRVSSCKMKKKWTVQVFKKTACGLSLHNETIFPVNSSLSKLVTNCDQQLEKKDITSEQPEKQ